jgi:hypothetical protein
MPLFRGCLFCRTCLSPAASSCSPSAPPSSSAIRPVPPLLRFVYASRLPAARSHRVRIPWQRQHAKRGCPVGRCTKVSHTAPTLVQCSHETSDSTTSQPSFPPFTIPAFRPLLPSGSPSDTTTWEDTIRRFFRWRPVSGGASPPSVSTESGDNGLISSYPSSPTFAGLTVKVTRFRFIKPAAAKMSRDLPPVVGLGTTWASESLWK